jgi:hypothetical protein
MNLIQVPRILTLAIFLAAALSSAQGQVSGVENFQIHVTNPSYTGLPVWIYAELNSPLEIRYPYGEDPEDFGPNRLELTREHHLLEQLPFKPWVGGGGILDGSIAPPSSPKNRLPLHLLYSLDKPGMYSVRWTLVRNNFQNGQMTETIVAQSDWLDFEIRPSTPEQRKGWFEEHRKKISGDAGEFVGDFLPSLLANVPDQRGLEMVLEQMYSNQPLISGCALGSLRFFRDEDVRVHVLDTLYLRGPNEGLAYVISWHAAWFQDQKEDIVRNMIPYLHSPEDWQVAATLKLLGFMVHLGNFHWPPDSATPTNSDVAVLAAAQELVGRSTAVSRPLAEYLGGIRSNDHNVRDLLWQVAERPEPAREQALIALTWVAEALDLPRLAELLIKPGDSDRYGRNLASLPYSLVRAYGDRAIPYLERAVSESTYAFVRTQSAEQLALRGRPVAFAFFLDALEKDRFYKQELVTWLKAQFANELPATVDDASAIAFLKGRSQQ